MAGGLPPALSHRTQAPCRPVPAGPKMVAVQNYHGNPAPPGKPVLTFQTGDVIELLRGDPESQWWEVGPGAPGRGWGGGHARGREAGCRQDLRSLPGRSPGVPSPVFLGVSAFTGGGAQHPLPWVSCGDGAVRPHAGPGVGWGETHRLPPRRCHVGEPRQPWTQVVSGLVTARSHDPVL